MGLNGEGTEGTLIIPLLNVPLTSSPSIDNLTCAQHDQATTLEGITDPKTKARRIEQGAVSLKTFHEAASDTPLAFYVALDEQIRDCLEEFQALTALLDGLCGEQAPHSSNIKNTLFHCQEVVSTVAGDRIKQATAPVRGSHGRGLSTNGSVPATYDFQNQGLAEAFDDESELAEVPPLGPGQGIPSRDHALVMLEAIAAYFRQTEPHSPIPYTLEQTVRWGRMPLPALLTELIPDQNAREHYFRMVGIPTHSGVT
jgi:type VI secretion system protein ImpA